MASHSVAIIDYGMGNLHSVASALAYVDPDAHVIITADAEVIKQADRVIFPGVGAIRDCMREIRRLGFDTLVPQLIDSGVPVLAICVGMQALMQSSEENGGVDCIGVFPGHVKFFGDPHKDSQGELLKVPHMGWNQVFQQQNHPLWHNIEDGERFYFVHSYYVEADNAQQILGKCEYGNNFVAAMSQNNLFATQFHPEKSHHAGLQLLKNFMSWRGE